MTNYFLPYFPESKMSWCIICNTNLNPTIPGTEEYQYDDYECTYATFNGYIFSFCVRCSLTGSSFNLIRELNCNKHWVPKIRNEDGTPYVPTEDEQKKRDDYNNILKERREKYNKVIEYTNRICDVMNNMTLRSGKKKLCSSLITYNKCSDIERHKIHTMYKHCLILTEDVSLLAF